MSKNYDISFKHDEKLTKLLKAVASKKRAEFDEAVEALAAFIEVVALQVVAQAPTVGNFFTPITYEKGTAPMIPLDSYYDIRDRNYIQVWTQSMPGGLATSFVKGLARMIADVYTLESAASMFKEDAEAGRLDVFAATIERLAQELLIAHDTNAANILSAALGQARYTNLAGASVPQGIRANTAGEFGMHDYNRLITLAQRIRPSWVGGTPVNGQTLSQLVASPEVMQDIRSIAYQPQNTRAVPNTDESTVLAAPESVREQVFSAAGNPSFFGTELVTLYELGVGQPYNTLFSNYIGATAIDGGAAFTAASEEIVWALSLNTNRRALLKLTERGVNSDSTMSVQPDDQFPMRSKKVGWTTEQKVGYVITDHRNLSFAVV